MFVTLEYDQGIRKILYNIEDGLEISVHTDQDGTLQFVVKKKVEVGKSSDSKKKVEEQNPSVQNEGKISSANRQLMEKKAFYKPFKPSKDEKEIIKKSYEAGETTKKIAFKYHTTTYKIEMLLRNMNVEIRKKNDRSERLSSNEKNAVINLLRFGFSKDEVADELGLTFAQVAYFCKISRINYKE